MAVKKSELYSVLWEACNKLRGGVEPSRYKDYVLVLLFFKYVSDKYKDQRFAEFKISKGASFEDLVSAKGKSDVGERVDKILQKFLEDNKLQGALPDVSFNNPDELGRGKELVDKVSGLISIFQNPAIDFKNNKASGDDIIGDAYEYFMMKFAQESGKSKGQFYTPSEVSRVLARLVGIGEIVNDANKKWTLHDPAAGSGSLLIRAADEAPTDKNGDSIVTIFGQEKYPDTAGLAKMNFILHNKGTGEIKSANTLSNPQYKDDFGNLRKFDFIVMNPPFSDKEWSDGIKPEEDTYKRFDGFGLPPAKNGDYAWFLHVLKSLKKDGKAGIILPHGVLFRGNAEESIRNKILEKKIIKGIVGLPSNLFYGTSIPACIIIIDKSETEKRKGIFMIDASDGYKKDGSKNRLREQDIEKIIQTFNGAIEEKGYSTFVKYDDIIKANGGNLNVSRYIQKVDRSLPQNITSHLKGGIPEYDVNSTEILWKVSPYLKNKIYKLANDNLGLYELAISPSDIETVISSDKEIISVKQKETEELFSGFYKYAKERLLCIDENTDLKKLIRSLGENILNLFESAVLSDNYDIYDFLLNYWNEKLYDDLYIIKNYGYISGREIDFVYAQKKVTNEYGEKVKTDDKTKMKSFDGVLIPRNIVEEKYFCDESNQLRQLIDKSIELGMKLEELREEQSGDEGLYNEVFSSTGNIPKANLNKRISELDSKKTSLDIDNLNKLLSLFASGKTDDMNKLFEKESGLKKYTLHNKNGSFGKGKIKTALKEAFEHAILPDIYIEEYEALVEYQQLATEKDDTDKEIKTMQKKLDELVIQKFSELTEDEIKTLIFDKKWMSRLREDIINSIDQKINLFAARISMIAKRYEFTLEQLETKTSSSREKVRKALERMGYKW